MIDFFSASKPTAKTSHTRQLRTSMLTNFALFDTFDFNFLNRQQSPPYLKPLYQAQRAHNLIYLVWTEDAFSFSVLGASFFPTWLQSVRDFRRDVPRRHCGEREFCFVLFGAIFVLKLLPTLEFLMTPNFPSLWFSLYCSKLLRRSSTPHNLQRFSVLVSYFRSFFLLIQFATLGYFGDADSFLDLQNWILYKNPTEM